MKKSDKKTKKEKEERIEEDKASAASKAVTAMRSEKALFIAGLLCVCFAVYLLLASVSFLFTGGSDQSIVNYYGDQANSQIQNSAGPKGAQLAQFLINGCFGIPSFLIIVFLVIAGMKLMKAYSFNLTYWFVACAVTMVWCSVLFGFALAPLFSDSFIYPGGLHGYNISMWLRSQVGVPGLILLLLLTGVIFSAILTNKTMFVVRKAFHPTFSFRRKKKEDKDVPGDENVSPEPEPVMPEEETEMPYEPAEDDTRNENSIIDLPVDGKDDTPPLEVELAKGYAAEDAPVTVPEYEVEDDNDEVADSDTDTPELEIVNNAGDSDDDDFEEDNSRPYNPRLDLEYYNFPTVDLLNDFDDKTPDIDIEEKTANGNQITKVLKSFGIEISSIKASVGPTVTLYEITPAEGVRISKIRNLEDDIALSLSALGIRIIAPIPGKGTIGIEVPNATPHIVPMKSILTNRKFIDCKFDLPVALGKTITNDVFIVDLAKAPHMLVAGATGQGKSVGLNAIVTSLLYKKHPSELKFVIIDPKKVEFAIYAPIERHYLAKLPDAEDAIITDVTKVVQTLNSLCAEMDMRYSLLRDAGCRHIKEYNAKFINRQLNPEKGHRFLPYIVIIIDEFGDLMMTAGKEVELPICRIAQLARAVGIHAIIATQRPTTNIITGTIKANFPARVAFRVASMMDSRTILDRPGANQLIGKGDMLYLQGSDPVRVQCAFVDTPEVERVVDFISRQQGYPTAFLLPEAEDGSSSSSSSGDMDMNRLDPLFEEAARLIIYHQQGSTSLIQRKFSIGYNRAGRIMDQLEHAGIVGPANGAKARDVLCMDENDLHMRMQNLKA